MNPDCTFEIKVTGNGITGSSIAKTRPQVIADVVSYVRNMEPGSTLIIHHLDPEVVRQMDAEADAMAEAADGAE